MVTPLQRKQFQDEMGSKDAKQQQQKQQTCDDGLLQQSLPPFQRSWWDAGRWGWRPLVCPPQLASSSSSSSTLLGRNGSARREGRQEISAIAGERRQRGEQREREREKKREKESLSNNHLLPLSAIQGRNITVSPADRKSSAGSG